MHFIIVVLLLFVNVNLIQGAKYKVVVVVVLVVY